MAKLTLTDLANLSNEATVVAAINANNTSTETALENTLSRDGTSPNQMEATFDMNSNRIINLPAPVTDSEPLRLSDANTLIAGGTISTTPSGGGTGDILVKASATDYDVEWATQASMAVSTATQTALDLKANLASPALTGTPTAPTAAPATDTTQIATTAFVLANAATLSSSTPLINGIATAGVESGASRGDHVHPTDTSRAPLASPTFTGSPAAPTPAFGADSTLIATMAAVQGAVDALGLAIPVINGKFVATVGSSALTVTLKTIAGNDPSSSDPVFVYFRSATLTDGVPVKVSITSALSLTVPSTATMGFTSAVPGRLYVTLVNTGSGVVLGLQNCSAAFIIHPLVESQLVSTTLMDTGSDSAGVMYTAAAQTSKPFRIAAVLSWETALGTAGTWSAAPDVNQLFGPGVRKPGDVVQVRRSTVSASTSTTSATYVDTGLTDSITPTSAVNKIKVGAALILDNGVGVNSQIRARIHRGSTAIGNEGQNYSAAANETIVSGSQVALDSPGVSTSTTYTIKIKSITGTTVYFNTNNLQTEMLLEEIVG